ncbi:SMM1 [Candida theae]|uniref:SMM1 n=1 Tax=Candida theae TaxID=1198502 RepID=A0AAD5BC34_9ASCO|nr:SMM1 [Candida theae]KAI5953744.1 SMM1 [Candida theae]
MLKRMVDYTNKVCLAPMVRSGELPIRLLSLKYDCDLVWSPELIDKKLISTTRVENAKLGTVDYIAQNNHNHSNNNNKKQSQNHETVVFRKHPNEAGKLILQLGTSDPNLAVAAAEKVIQDVDGIDLNCGCPKSFSTHSGMGAELLKTPELLCSILTNLVEKVGKPNNKPISCKIRLLPNYEASRRLVEQICSTTGIANLTIHCRTPIMRNRQDPIWNYLPKLIPLIESFGISVVLNGNFQSRSDLQTVQQALNNDRLSIMIAEAAEANPSVFASMEKEKTPTKSVQSQHSLINEVYELGSKYHLYSGTKFMIMNMIPGKSKYYQKFSQSKNFEQMKQIIDELNSVDKDEEKDKIFQIMNKNCQKSHFFQNAQGFENYITGTRRDDILQFFGNWESNQEEMLQDLKDSPTKRTVEIPKHKLKRQKKSDGHEAQEKLQKDNAVGVEMDAKLEVQAVSANQINGQTVQTV